MVLMGDSGAQGTLIYEKYLKARISCQTPFKTGFCERDLGQTSYMSPNPGGGWELRGLSQ
jgi:hypothetical protein